MQAKILHDSISIFNSGKSFVSECQRALNATTAGTAIYILSCLYPEDFSVILELLRFDLNQPHDHPLLSKKCSQADLRSNTNVISSLQTYARVLPAKEYSCLWLEIVEHWLLTCPVDEEYYAPDETGKDLFCHKLRSDLLDRILNIS